MLRSLLAAFAASLLACAPREMLRVEPAQLAGQDVIYKSGVPIVVSKASESEVVIQPVTSATGRYELRDRAGFVAAIRNLSPRRIEVSEASISAWANRELTHVVRATEIEDEIRVGAAWAQALNVVAGALEGANAPRYARYEVARNTAATSAAIDASARMQTARLASGLQRTTLESGEIVAGGVLIEAPRTSACSIDPPPIEGREYGYVRRPGPCSWILRVTVGNDQHVFRLNETLAR